MVPFSLKDKVLTQEQVNVPLQNEKAQNTEASYSSNI